MGSTDPNGRISLMRMQAQQSRSGLIAAQAQRLADTAALYQALGGGYAGSSEHAGI
jgi:outer membrane protein TolC